MQPDTFTPLLVNQEVLVNQFATEAQTNVRAIIRVASPDVVKRLQAMLASMQIMITQTFMEADIDGTRYTVTTKEQAGHLFDLIDQLTASVQERNTKNENCTHQSAFQAGICRQCNKII